MAGEWQSALVEKAYYYLTDCQLTIHEERQAQYSIENCAASIDYCHRPSAIVCDMETKFDYL